MLSPFTAPYPPNKIILHYVYPHKNWTTQIHTQKKWQAKQAAPTLLLCISRGFFPSHLSMIERGNEMEKWVKKIFPFLLLFSMFSLFPNKRWLTCFYADAFPSHIHTKNLHINMTKFPLRQFQCSLRREMILWYEKLSFSLLWLFLSFIRLAMRQSTCNFLIQNPTLFSLHCFFS